MRKYVFTEKLPSGNYSVRYWDNGKFKREWFEDYALAKQREADLLRILLARKQGQPNPINKPIDILTQYLASLEHTHRPITRLMKKQNLEPFVSNSQYITEKRIKEWQQEMLTKGLSISTVSIRMRDLKAMCKWAKKENLLDASVFENIQVPTSKMAGRKISKEELKAIWDNADTDFKPYLAFLIYTGARKGELSKARWEDIDLDEGLWRIPAENCKTRRERIVPLAKALTDMLIPMPNKQGLVFAWSRHRPQWLLTKACAKAKVEQPRIHDFRHSYASHWTGDSRKLMDMVGWTSTSMLKRYSHFTTEDLRKEAEEKGIASSLDL